MTERERYRTYLASPEWAAVRERRIAAADGRCEFVEQAASDRTDDTGRCLAVEESEFERSERERYYGHSLQESVLQVHHLNYDTLGAERDCDLAVFCRFHHLVVHVLERAKCQRCGAPLIAGENEAIELVEDWTSDSGRIEDVSADEIIDCLDTEFCDACDEMVQW
jgi:hypothetical protein